jgi:hypothetical protein
VAFHTKAWGQAQAVVNAGGARALLQHVQVTSDDDGDDNDDVAAETAARPAHASIEASTAGPLLITPCPTTPANTAARCFDAVRDALGTTQGRIGLVAAVGMARDEGVEAVIFVDHPEDGAAGSCRSLDVASHGPTADAATVAAFLSASASASATRACNLRAAVAEAGRSGAPTLVYLTPAAVHVVTEGPMLVPADASVKVRVCAEELPPRPSPPPPVLGATCVADDDGEGAAL